MYDYEEMFGNDSGEDETQEFLASYFVKLDNFDKFFSETKPLSIVRARKGMGKSSLISMLNKQLQDLSESNIVINVKGNELMTFADFSSSDHSSLENAWKEAICRRICIEIGSNIKWAMNDQKMSMVEASEIAGYKDQNLLSSLASRIGGLIVSSVGAQSDVGISLKTGVQNPTQILTRYQKDDNIKIWVLVDDIDAKYTDTPSNQEKVGAFFSALRSLAFGVKNLNIRASVRTDVWLNLRRMEDQDKLRQYIIDIDWKDETLRSILAKKILSYIHRHHFNETNAKWNVINNYSNIMNSVFDSSFTWAGRKEDPFIPLKIFSGSRPRWMGQLCKLAGEQSNGRIKLENVIAIMKKFGTEKFSDLNKEHCHQFVDLFKLVEAFRNGEREYNRYQLLKRIQTFYVKKVNSVVPDIDGYVYNNTNQSDLICDDQLGEFLFKIEMITPKYENKYDTLYQDEPDLFKTEDNYQNKITWMVNQSYRTYLGIH